MNIKFSTPLIIAALIMPVAAYADTTSATESVKENVGDAAITAKIKAEFAKDKDVSALHINVDTDHKGVVTLRGNAKSQAEAEAAARIARDTKGVTSVRNEIVVGDAEADADGKKSITESVKENVGDAVITTKIKAEFAKDKDVSALKIKVDTDDKGVVTLSGNAGSKQERIKAARIARSIKGVTSVKNEIKIEAK
jgi:hyperosmotically inducible periplasmic protein